MLEEEIETVLEKEFVVAVDCVFVGIIFSSYFLMYRLVQSY